MEPFKKLFIVETVVQIIKLFFTIDWNVLWHGSSMASQKKTKITKIKTFGTFCFS